ncbi:hypothetical protein D3C73_662740 [compost metagenome]
MLAVFDSRKNAGQVLPGGYDSRCLDRQLLLRTVHRTADGSGAKFLIIRKIGPEPAGNLSESKFISACKQQKLRGKLRRILLNNYLRRRLFQNNVGIGSAKSEGVHAGPQRGVSGGFPPPGMLIHDIKRGMLEINIRIRLFVIYRMRKNLMLQRQHHFDQAGHPCGG